MAIHTNVSTPPDEASAIFTLKSLIVAAGGAVLASGSGNGASTAGADYSASGDISPGNGDGLQVANAWFVVRLGPSGTRCLRFVRGALQGQWTIAYSASGFTVGTDASTAGTSAESQTLITGAFLAADGTYRWLASADDAAPYGVFAAALTTGTLAATAAVAVLGLETGSYDAAEQDPYVTYAGTSSGVLAWGELYEGYSGNKNFRSWYRYTPGLSGSTWAPTPFLAPWMGTSNIGGTSSMVSLGALSSVSGQEVPLDILCGFRPGAGSFSIKGRVAGARFTSSTTGTAPNGTHLTDGNSAYWVRVGDLWLQWDSSVPSL